MNKPLSGPYYGLHEEMRADDHRQALWADQRATRGFDNTELWNLDTTFSKFVLPRLKAFKDTGYESAEMVGELDKMIAAFQAIVDGKHFIGVGNDIEVGLKSFHDNFFSLWN